VGKIVYITWLTGKKAAYLLDFSYKKEMIDFTAVNFKNPLLLAKKLMIFS
jgi:hypothetical protein